VLGDDLLLGLVGVRAQEALLFGEPLHQLAHRCVRVALGFQDPRHLRVDPPHLGEPELVDLVGAQVRGGAGSDALPVVGLAVRQLPDPGIVRRAALQVGRRFGQPVIPVPHRHAVVVTRRGPVLLAPVRRLALRLVLRVQQYTRLTGRPIEG
jgi:hypothetical protein